MLIVVQKNVKLNYKSINILYILRKLRADVIANVLRNACGIKEYYNTITINH